MFAVPLPTDEPPVSLSVLLLCPPIRDFPPPYVRTPPVALFFVLLPETSQTSTRQPKSSLESFLLLTGSLLNKQPCCCHLSSSAPVRSQPRRLLPLRRFPKEIPQAAPPPHPRQHPHSRLLLHQPQSQRIQLPSEQYVHLASQFRGSHLTLLLTGVTEWLQVCSYYDKCFSWGHNWSGPLHLLPCSQPARG